MVTPDKYLVSRSAGALRSFIAAEGAVRRIARFLIRLLAPVVKDGFNRYRRQFLAMLPVPDASPQVVREIARAAQRGDARGADELSIRLFALADADLLEVDRFLNAAP